MSSKKAKGRKRTIRVTNEGTWIIHRDSPWICIRKDTIGEARLSKREALRLVRAIVAAVDEGGP